MNGFSFDLVTGEYRATLTMNEANNPQVRSDITAAAPPDRLDGHALVWNGSQWSNVVDQRGQTYIDDAGNEIIWSQLGPMPASSSAGVLARAKDEKRAEIKAARQAAIDAPLQTQWGTFDSDKTARDNIANTVQLLDKLAERGMPSDTTFGLAGGARITMTREDMGTVGLMLGAKVQAAYDRAGQLMDAIDAATTTEEVGSIQWAT